MKTKALVSWFSVHKLIVSLVIMLFFGAQLPRAAILVPAFALKWRLQKEK